jgi:hypothetical protein
MGGDGSIRVQIQLIRSEGANAAADRAIRMIYKIKVYLVASQAALRRIRCQLQKDLDDSACSSGRCSLWMRFGATQGEARRPIRRPIAVLAAPPVTLSCAATAEPVISRRDGGGSISWSAVKRAV